MADEDEGRVVVDMDKVEFANRTDFGDDKLNDVRNFQGLLKHSDYLKRKQDLTKEPVDPREEAAKRKKLDDLSKAKDQKALQERMEKKKQALKQELKGKDGGGGRSASDGAGEGKEKAKKSKKAKKAKAAQLSFNMDDEEEAET